VTLGVTCMPSKVRGMKQAERQGFTYMAGGFSRGRRAVPRGTQGGLQARVVPRARPMRRGRNARAVTQNSPAKVAGSPGHHREDHGRGRLSLHAQGLVTAPYREPFRALQRAPNTAIASSAIGPFGSRRNTLADFGGAYCEACSGPLAGP